MNDNKFFSLKSLPAKCLLACILFFSFITIAGCGVDAKCLTQQACKTELLYSAKEQVVKKTALFGEYSFLPVKTTYGFYRYNLFNLVAYNRLLKVKINLYNKRVYSRTIISWLNKIKTVPQTSAEKPFPYFTA